jgi:hypothetical protein
MSDEKNLGTCHSSLDFVYLNFRVTLAVALFSLVLFATLFLEYDNLFAAAVTDNSSVHGHATDLIAGNESFDADLVALFAFYGRHADRLTLGHRKLLSA